MSYKIVRVTGDYRARQVAANNASAALYLEAHYNSTPGAQGTEVLVTDSSGPLTRLMARQMAGNIAQAFALKLRAESGVKVLSSKDRGYGNLAHAKAPALLIEPWFIDDAAWADRAETEAARVARCLYSVIAQHVPAGSTIALSLGHRGKTSDPHDRGARGGNGKWEADMAKLYLDALAQQLSDIATSEKPAVMPNVEPAEALPSPWAEEAWAYVEGNGLMSGNPRGAVDRQTLATALYRYHLEMKK